MRRVDVSITHAWTGDASMTCRVIALCATLLYHQRSAALTNPVTLIFLHITHTECYYHIYSYYIAYMSVIHFKFNHDCHCLLCSVEIVKERWRFAQPWPCVSSFIAIFDEFFAIPIGDYWCPAFFSFVFLWNNKKWEMIVILFMETDEKLLKIGLFTLQRQWSEFQIISCKIKCGEIIS